MEFEQIKALPTDLLIGAYLKLRDQKDSREKEFKEGLKPLNQAMENLNAVLTERLEADGSNSISTDNGTAYRTERTSVKVKDWDMSLGWVLDNEAWGFLERRLNKTAVETFLEENGELPPGVGITRELRVNVRRK